MQLLLGAYNSWGEAATPFKQTKRTHSRQVIQMSVWWAPGKSVLNFYQLRTDLPPTHLSAKSGNFGAERVPERFQGSPMVQMKAESKTFNMAYHKIWIYILGYD